MFSAVPLQCCHDAQRRRAYSCSTAALTHLDMDVRLVESLTIRSKWEELPPTFDGALVFVR